MVVSCVGGLVHMRGCSSHNRSTGGLLIRANCMQRMHHIQRGADDVTGLSIDSLTASIRADRPWQRRPGLQAPTCHAVLWQLCSRAHVGAASGIAAALVSAPILTENGRVLRRWPRPHARLLKPQPEHANCMQRMHHIQRAAQASATAPTTAPTTAPASCSRCRATQRGFLVRACELT